MPELFVELFGEEIPARMQVDAEERLAKTLSKELADAGLGGGDAVSWSGPRRLAVAIKDIAVKQADLNEERRGPRADAPEQAVAGFLKGAGITRDQAEIRSTPKGDFLFAIISQKGRDAKDVVPEIMARILADFAWPKSMRWGRSSKRWVRPLHRVSVLFDGVALDGGFDLGGGQQIAFGSSTLGHRMVAPHEIPLSSADRYDADLAKQSVIASRAKREEMISAAMADTLKSAGGKDDLSLRPDQGLMAEVVGLVEYPHPIMGRIDEDFMALPPEILITSMRSHQKYFAVQHQDGTLAPYFVTIANMTPDAARDALIRAGNERVLKARLADADFFWTQDKSKPLADNIDTLSGITFFEGLGTMRDKAGRIAQLARHIAGLIGADADAAERAGLLAKADLVSETVGEFPELQGIIGGYLARAHEDNEVATAIDDHYRPEGPGEDAPTIPLSAAVALADKIDTLVGFFGVGAVPTGSKDPYALRRSALGVIRIIVEGGHELDLENLLEASAKIHGFESVPEGLSGFMGDRLKVWMRDQGVRHDVVNAVLAHSRHDPAFNVAVANAVADLLKTDDGQGLMAGYRRASNILAAEEKKDARPYNEAVKPEVFTSDDERHLFDNVTTIEAMSTDTTDDVIAYLTALGALRGPIDQFFERNTVNDDDASIRENRLNLMGHIRGVMQKFADFGQIEH